MNHGRDHVHNHPDTDEHRQQLNSINITTNHSRSYELRQIMHNLADVGITSEQSIRPSGTIRKQESKINRRCSHAGDTCLAKSMVELPLNQELNEGAA
jgi:hypothetical protein